MNKQNNKEKKDKNPNKVRGYELKGMKLKDEQQLAFILMQFLASSSVLVVENLEYVYDGMNGVRMVKL